MKKRLLSSKTKGIIISYIYFVLNAILSIVLSAFIIRSVGKTDYGVYQSMTAFIAYLVLLEFGMSTIMTRNISLLKKDGSDDEDINKNVSTIWTATIVLSFVMLLFLFSFYFLIPVIYNNSLSFEQIVLGKKLFIFSGANLLITFLTSTLNGLILAYEKYSFEKIINLIKLLLRTLLIVVLLLIKTDILIVVIVDFALGFLSFAATLIYCLVKFKSPLTFKYFDKTILRLCMPLAMSMLIQSIVNTTNTVVDKFLISILMTPEDVSVYSITMLVFNMFSSLGTLPNALFIPTIAKHVKTNISGEGLTSVLVAPCRLNSLITGFIGFGYFLIGRQFISVVYGSDYVEAWLYSLIILTPLFFYLTNAIMAHVLTIYNKRQIMAYVSLVATFINILLTVFAIRIIGMLGASIATAISIFIQIIILNIYYKKKIGIKIMHLFKKSYSGIVPAFLLSILFVFPIQNRISNIYLNIIVSLTIYFVVFVIFYIILESKNKKGSTIKSIINGLFNNK